MSGNAHCAGGKVTDRLGLDRSDASVLGYLKVISPFPPHNEMIYPKQTIIKFFFDFLPYGQRDFNRSKSTWPYIYNRGTLYLKNNEKSYFYL